MRRAFQGLLLGSYGPKIWPKGCAGPRAADRRRECPITGLRAGAGVRDDAAAVGAATLGPRTQEDGRSASAKVPADARGRCSCNSLIMHGFNGGGDAADERFFQPQDQIIAPISANVHDLFSRRRFG